LSERIDHLVRLRPLQNLDEPKQKTKTKKEKRTKQVNHTNPQKEHTNLQEELAQWTMEKIHPPKNQNEKNQTKKQKTPIQKKKSPIEERLEASKKPKPKKQKIHIPNSIFIHRSHEIPISRDLELSIAPCCHSQEILRALPEKPKIKNQRSKTRHISQPNTKKERKQENSCLGLLSHKFPNGEPRNKSCTGIKRNAKTKAKEQIHKEKEETQSLKVSSTFHSQKIESERNKHGKNKTKLVSKAPL